MRNGADGEWLKIGDGVTAWNDLPYKKGPRGEMGHQGAQGPKGDKGDKGEKGDDADVVIDQTYNPESENAQSGVAVKEAIGTWEKIVDITTTEEVNTIIVTAEEFPKIAKCKEFIMRVVFPKADEKISLGSSRMDINNGTLCFHANTTDINTSEAEQRADISIIDGLIHTILTGSNTATAAVKGGANIVVGNRFLTEEIYQLKYYLIVNEKVLPVGTKFYIYGKVEG